MHTTHLTVHESVESIPKDAFRHCRELREVHLPEGLKSIGEDAFKGCSWMEKINLPSSLTSIGIRAFYDCDVLEFTSAEYIYMGGDASLPKFTTHLVISAEIIPNNLLRCFSNRSFGSAVLVDVNISEGLHDIGTVFQEEHLLRKISLPSTVTLLPFGTFRNCWSLTEVNLPDSIETIVQSAFRGCTKLRSLRIPPSVKKLERNIFDGCDSLLSLELPEEMSNIEKFTFSGKKCLRNIAIPMDCTVGEGNWFVKLPSDEETDIVLNSANAQADEISVAKQRFDGLPIHKLCYYQPESLVQYLNQPMNSIKEKRELTTGMLKDKLGMTPLHILACSTRQSIEMYQLLLELYPENLITKDKWGELPLLYAFWSNASKEILQLLVKSHKELFPNHIIDWGGMFTTLGKYNVSPICIHNVLDMYDSLCLKNVDWEAKVIDLAQPVTIGQPFCNKETMRFILRSVITKRLSLVGIGNCREEMVKDVNSWQYCQDKVGRYKKLFSKLSTYEYQNEVATLLELALWKVKIDRSASNKNITDDSSKKKARTGEDRLESHASCGADIILPHVIAFLFRKAKKVVGPSTSSAEESENNSEQDDSDSDEGGSDSEEENSDSEESEESSDAEEDNESHLENEDLDAMIRDRHLPRTENDEIESDVLHEEASAESRPVDTRRCAICRNSNNEPSIEYQANPSPTNDNGLSITFGNCGHAFHLDCIQRWLKARSVCPLCNKEWDFTKIERIPGFAASDGEEAEASAVTSPMV